MNRAEHLQWCKDRAKKLLDAGKYEEVVTSMMSDLSNHPDTELKGSTTGYLILLGRMEARNRNYLGVKRWIEGFN